MSDSWIRKNKWACRLPSGAWLQRADGEQTLRPSAGQSFVDRVICHATVGKAAEERAGCLVLDLSCVPQDAEKGRRKLQVCDSE